MFVILFRQFCVGLFSSSVSIFIPRGGAAGFQSGENRWQKGRHRLLLTDHPAEFLFHKIARRARRPLVQPTGQGGIRPRRGSPPSQIQVNNLRRLLRASMPTAAAPQGRRHYQRSRVPHQLGKCLLIAQDVGLQPRAQRRHHGRRGDFGRRIRGCHHWKVRYPTGKADKKIQCRRFRYAQPSTTE